MASDTEKYSEIFDYLSASSIPTSPEAAVVFGRADPLVAHAAGELAVASLAEIIVISGGMGKDSGNIHAQGYRSEAHYLGEQLRNDAATRHYPLPKVILEEKATNGGENARYSLDILTAHRVDTGTVTAVAHATSARRLAETLKHETGKISGATPTIHIKPSTYNFDPSNPSDRNEAAAELLRVADWPEKGWLGKQTDLPLDLVDFVRSKHGEAPNPPTRIQSAVLRALPPKLRPIIIRTATRGK
jgi:uncharacterized SAM-binding protein YcdF (DUF218 family)